MLLWKIAWRNLLRHKGKTFVVGIILFIGMVIMTMGNAVLEGTEQGLIETLLKRFTGHVIITAKEQKRKDVFFARHEVKIIRNYSPLKELLKNQEYIDGFHPMARGRVMVLNQDGLSGKAFVFGVNFEAYQKFFLENIELVEGEFLTDESRGILVSTKTREDIFRLQKFWIVPEGSSLDLSSLTPKAREKFDNGRLKTKQELAIAGLSEDSLETDIRIPVKGIFRFKSANASWGMYSFIDIESFRQSFGHIMAGDRSEELTDAEKTRLAAEEIDDIFTDANVIEETDINPDGYDLEAIQQQTQHIESQKPVDRDVGAYSMVIIKLKDGMTPEEAKERLQSALKAAHLEMNVSTWAEVMGEVADMVVMLQGALVLFVMGIFFVAVIIIMNTLSMAALERVPEIGMMRAVGAQKNFISAMFFTETTQIAFVFGLAGIVTGVVCTWILAALKLPAGDNEMLEILFMGDYLHPIVNIGNLVLGVFVLAFVALLAMVYPILIARKITPLEAVTRD